MNNKNWFVNSDGDITDGQNLIAEPNYLTREGHANAALLAAAPELLAVLEDVIYALSDTDGNGLLEYTHWMVKARATIAKAKGEEVQDQLPF